MQRNNDPCPVCKNESDVGEPISNIEEPHKAFWDVICERCGHFQITTEADVQVRKASKSKCTAVTGWIRLQNRNGLVPQVTFQLLTRIFALPKPTISERAEYLLAEMTQLRSELWLPINFEEPRFQASAYFNNHEDLLQLANYLETKGLIASVTREGCVVTMDGQIFAENLMRRPPVSKKCFVAMWFDECMGQVYENGFSLGIMQAGYDPIRIDRVDHINKIDDEIIAHIKSSAFIVADFTGQRGGVYFEAGFAMGLGLPVVWTCRSDDVEKLHFDIRQYNCVVWEKPEELASNLKNRIEATIGRGPLVEAAD